METSLDFLGFFFSAGERKREELEDASFFGPLFQNAPWKSCPPLRRMRDVTFGQIRTVAQNWHILHIVRSLFSSFPECIKTSVILKGRDKRISISHFIRTCLFSSLDLSFGGEVHCSRAVWEAVTRRGEIWKKFKVPRYTRSISDKNKKRQWPSTSRGH